MKYLVVIEQGPSSYGAYVPDLPGCASMGDTYEEAIANIREAVVCHLEGLRIDGEAATVESLIESGPENLAREIAEAIAEESSLNEDERKN